MRRATQPLDAAHVVVDETGADPDALGDSASRHRLPAAVNDEPLRGCNQLLVSRGPISSP